MPHSRDIPDRDPVLTPSTKVILFAGVVLAGGLAAFQFSQKAGERRVAEKKRSEDARLEEHARLEQESRDKQTDASQQAAAKKLEAAARKQELDRKDVAELRQRFDRMCREIAGTSTARIETSQKSIEHVVSGDKVYFPGFRTPTYSQAEHESRQRQVFEAFPFEEDDRRYKIVKKTKAEMQDIPELKIDVHIPVDGLELTSVLFIVSRNQQPLSTLNFSAEDFVFATDPFQPGAQIRRTIPAEKFGGSPSVCLALLGPDKRTGAVLQLGGEVLANQRELVEKLFAKFLANVAAKNEEHQKNAWLKNRDAVAAAYAQRLVDTGRIISARLGAKGSVGNYVNYDFTFETQGGLIRINRNGYIKLERQQNGTWLVTGVNIDGTDQIELWP